MLPKRNFDINGSGMSTSYWGGKPKPKDKNPLENDDELHHKRKNNFHGSSKSEENNFSKFKLETIKESRKHPNPISSSKSDDNYAKSYLIKEKELQDKLRNNPAFRIENDKINFNKLNGSNPKNFLSKEQSKPPINPSTHRKLEQAIPKENNLSLATKLVETQIEIPADINNLNQTYRIRPQNKIKYLEAVPPATDSLTYRVDDETAKPIKKVPKTKKIEEVKIIDSTEPKPVKTYQNIYKKIEPNKLNPLKNDEIPNILPINQVQLPNTILDVQNHTKEQTNKATKKAKNQIDEPVIVVNPIEEIKPIKIIPKIVDSEPIQQNESNPVHRVKSFESAEAVKKTDKNLVKKNSTLNAKTKLFNTENTKANKIKPKELNEIQILDTSAELKEDKQEQSKNEQNKVIEINELPIKEVKKNEQNKVKKAETINPKVKPAEAVIKKGTDDKVIEQIKPEQKVAETEQISMQVADKSELFRVGSSLKNTNESNQSSKTSNQVKVSPSIRSSKNEITNHENSNQIKDVITNETIADNQKAPIQIKVSPSMRTSNSQTMQPNQKVGSNKKLAPIKQEEISKNNDTNLTVPQITNEELPQNSNFKYERLSNRSNTVSNNVVIKMDTNETDFKEKSDSILTNRTQEPSLTPIEKDDKPKEIFEADTTTTNERSVEEQAEIVPKIKKAKKEKEPKPPKTPKVPKELRKNYINCINIFSMLLCVICPITGLLSIYYSKKSKKYFEMKDVESTKKSLNKSEWMLIFTFFLGAIVVFALIAFLAFYLKWIN